MVGLIFLAGAPGTGKTTVCRLLQKKLKNPPYVDFGWIREFHLDRMWKKASKKEEQMSFENLVFMLRHYLKKGYKNVIVTDFQDHRICQIPKLFPKKEYRIFTLVLDDKTLKKRVLIPTRDSGFRNVKKALTWNKKVINRRPLPNEIKLDNSHQSPEKTVKVILNMLKRKI